MMMMMLMLMALWWSHLEVSVNYPSVVAVRNGLKQNLDNITGLLLGVIFLPNEPQRDHEIAHQPRQKPKEDVMPQALFPGSYKATTSSGATTLPLDRGPCSDLYDMLLGHVMISFITTTA